MFLIVYLRMYGHCLVQALQGVAKNPWTLALPMALFLGFSLAVGALGGLGIVGGFIAGLVQAAVFSCYLYFTAGTVALQKMTVGELKKSFLVYFWSVIGLFFVIWVANIVLSLGLSTNPQRGTITMGLNLIALIVCNPAPEVIYTKGTRGGMDTISVCVRFLQESWIEWFVPQLLIGAGGYFFVMRVLPLLPGTALLILALFAGALFHVLMLFRGHLFQELEGSTHRQRMFKFRNASQ